MCLQDMHLLAERTILAALQAAGLLAGDLEAMLEARLGAVFMPHGVSCTVYCVEQGRLRSGCALFESQVWYQTAQYHFAQPEPDSKHVLHVPLVPYRTACCRAGPLPWAGHA
jgi:hypothetical protein